MDEELAAEVAVAVGDEPAANGESNRAEDEEFIADDEGGQDDKGDAADDDGSAGGDAADNGLQRRPKEGNETENEQGDANPDGAFEAGKFGG